MKTILPSSRSRTRDAGFTLVELLVVIAIIGILAAMILPVLAAVKKHAQVVQAQTQISGIVTAIEAYDSAYGRFPISDFAQQNANPDFTYGGTILAPDNSVSGIVAITNGAALTRTNDEVVAILMDVTNYSGGGATVNMNHVKNPQQTTFLNAGRSGDNSSPGVGNDLVYRDPWGNPYMITMDLNYDEQCRDSFYCLSAVSNPTGVNSNPGINGLANPDTTKADNFQYHGKVMVWSAGPDRKINFNAGNLPEGRANVGVNKDNVFSWK